MSKRGREAVGRWAAAGIYLLGACSVLVLAGIWMLRIEYVPFPEAMLPMKLHELAFSWLAVGAIPMWAATWGVHQFFGFARRRRPLRDTLMLAVPAILCSVCLVFEAAVVILMMAQGFFLARAG